MIRDYLRISFFNFKNRKLRAFLTVVGILIGMTAIISLISLGQGMKDAINSEFESVGIDRIIISAGGASFGPMGSSLAVKQLTEDDLDVVKKSKGVEKAEGILFKTAKIEFNGKVVYAQVGGTPTDADSRKEIENVGLFKVEDGRQFKESDKYAAILGYSVAHDMFKKDLKTGEKILINDAEFKIVGLQRKVGSIIHDNLVRIPLSTAREIFNEKTEVSSIFARTNPGFVPSDVAENIKSDLRKHRNVKEGEEDFSVQTSQQLISSLNTILTLVQVVITGIAAISLFVGGVGIMNTMYTAVTERRKDIGIMKSIGAKNSHILILFLIESGMIGIVGGALGIILGFGISFLVQLIAEAYGIVTLKASFSLFLIGGALIFSFLMGTISGVTPAIQASKLQPVEALRKK